MLKVEYKQLYNTAPCGYLCSTPEGKIIEANDRFLKFVGYNKEEIVNKKSLTDFLSKAGKIYYESTFLVILRLKGFVEELNFSLQKKEGGSLPVLINSSEVKDESGKCLYVQTTIFDITQRKSFESQILAAKKNAEKLTQELLDLNEDLKHLAYIATHDLKTPILDIEGHFNFLKDKIPLNNNESIESIYYVEEGIQKFKTTIEGLSEVIRVRNLEFNTEKINLSLELNKLIPKLQLKVEHLGGSLSIALEDDVPLLGNKVYLHSIIQNIIENAIKYCSTDRPLTINISGKFSSNFYCLTVQDNGLGIDLVKHKDRLFKMFNRFHDTNKAEGTGMGLYITKTMIEKMGGKIELESIVNKGSEFYLYFKKDK